jgi:hypothetical protein
MNGSEAAKRGMAALVERGRIAVTRGRAKPSHAKDAPEQLVAECQADAKAYNTLKHLSGVL